MIKFYPDKKVDGVSGWHWIETDSGAWDGPAKDWETSHRAKVLEFMRNSKKPMRNVIQAGGCQGMYPRLLSSWFERVWTFEPDEENYQALTMNTEMCPNVFPMRAALGPDNQPVSVVYGSAQNTGTHRVQPGGTVRQVMIDELGVDPDLIWLDIEGYEANALRGGLETIKRCTPVIVLELPRHDAQRVLHDLGYREFDSTVSDRVYMRT